MKAHTGTGWRQGLGRVMLGLAATCAGAAHAAIPIQHWTHASGARVYLVESPSIPMVDVQLDVDGGGRRDPATQAGLADATSGLLSGGVARQGELTALDENQLSQAWVDLGAQFGANASDDRFTVSLRSLTEPRLLQGALALAARQLAAPAWPDAVWQRDRARIQASLKEADTLPGTLAARAFSQAVYASHPYGFETTEASLNAISVPDMQAFYRRHLVACRAQLTLVGAINRQQADAMADQLLAALADHPCQPLPEVAQVAVLAEAKTINLPFDAAQAQVAMGQPGIRRDDPDFFPALVGNYILGGGGFASRLTAEVREKRGLSYSVYSAFSPGLHAGAFQLGLTTRPDQAGEAVKVAGDVLRGFVRQGPSRAELKAAQQYLVNGFALRIDSNQKLLDNVANIAWNGLPLDYLENWTQRVQAVSVQDIRRTFERVLQPERMVTVVVGGQP